MSYQITVAVMGVGTIVMGISLYVFIDRQARRIDALERVVQSIIWKRDKAK